MIDTLKKRVLKIINKVFNNLSKDKVIISDSIKLQIKNNIINYSPDNYFKHIKSIYNYIEYTYILPDISYDKVDKIIETSIEKKYAGTLLPQSFIKYARTVLNYLDEKHTLITCIDFPFGHSFFESKIEQAKILSYTDVDEIDIVLNISFLKEKKYFYIFNELYDIKNILKNKITKIVIENSFLNFEQKIEAAVLSYITNHEFICNTTNYGSEGIKLEDIILMKMIYGNNKIKAFGNINTKEYAEELVNHGADRIGITNPQPFF